MTVVNYSVQDTFGNNQFFWNGVGWFQELLDPSSELGGRFFEALWRTLLFSAHHPRDRDPARHRRSRSPCRARAGRSPLPRADGAAAAHSVERGRHDLAGLRPRRHRPARLGRQSSRHRLQLHAPTRCRPGSPSSSWTSGIGRRSSRSCATPACNRFPTPISRPRASMAPRAGRCSAHPAAEDAPVLLIAVLLRFMDSFTPEGVMRSKVERFTHGGDYRLFFPHGRN